MIELGETANPPWGPVEYEKAMLLLQMAQVRLLLRLCYQTQDNMGQGNETTRVVEQLDLAMGDQCPDIARFLGETG